MSALEGKRPKKRFTFKTAFIIFIIGVVLGAFGIMWAWHSNLLEAMNRSDSSQVTELSPSTVFSRVKDQGQLVSVSQDYSIVDKVTSQNQRFLDLFDIPFTQNSFWYRYVGTIKAGVNLETAELEQDSEDSSILHITLDQPEIISNTPNMDESGVLEENNNILNPISISESDEFQQQCQERSQQEAIDNGLYDEAKSAAEDDLTRLFNAAFGEGAYTLDFTYRDA